MPPARAYNNNLQSNIEMGAGIGGTGGLLVAGGALFIFANIAGFPEVETIELFHAVPALFIMGGGTGAVIGGAIGYAKTSPKPPPTSSTSSSMQCQQ